MFPIPPTCWSWSRWCGSPSLRYPRVSHSTYLLILVSVVRVSQSTLPPCFPFHLLADLGLGGAGLPVYVTPVFPIPPTCWSWSRWCGSPSLRYPRVSHSTYLLILVSVVRVSQSTLPPVFPIPPTCWSWSRWCGSPSLRYPRVSHSTYLLILVSVVRVSQSTLPPCFPFHLLADLGLGGAGLPVYATPRVSHSTYLLILVSVVRVSQSSGSRRSSLWTMARRTCRHLMFSSSISCRAASVRRRFSSEMLPRQINV